MYIIQDINSIDTTIAYPETLADAIKQKSGKTGFKTDHNTDVWITNSDKIAFTDAQLEHTIERDGKLYYKPFVAIDLKDGRTLTLNCKNYEQAKSVAASIGSYRNESDIVLSDILDYFDPERVVDETELEETEADNSGEVFELRWYEKVYCFLSSPFIKK